MMSARRAYFVSLVIAVGLAACGSDDTVLLVDVDQGTMAQPPTSISITAYKAENGARVQVGSSGNIAWADAIKGLGLKMKDSAAGELSIEAAGSPSGVAGPVSVTVEAKKSNGPIKLVFRDGAASIPDGGIPDGGIPDGSAEAGAPDDAHDGPEAVDASDTALPSPDVAVDTPPDTAVPSIDAAPDAGADTVDTAPDAALPSFTTPQSIDSTAVLARDPVIAVDPIREHVYVAWAEKNLVRVKRSSRTSATWGDTQDLRVEDGSPLSTSVRIAVDSAGKLYVAWILNVNSSTAAVAGVWVSQANPGEVLTLSPPQKIAAGASYELGMAVAGNGVVYLVHTIKDTESPFYNGVYTAFFDGTTWKANAEPLVTPDSQDAVVPSVAASGIGTAMAVFEKWVSGTKRTATFFLSGATRTDTGYLDLAASKGVNSRALTMSRQGEAAVAWTRDSSLDLYVAKYNPQAGWSTPVLVTYGQVQDDPAVVMADDGTITVAYAKQTGSTYNLAVQSGKVPGTFAAATPLESDNKSSSYTDLGDYLSEPHMAVDTAGNVLLVFHKKDNDTTGSLWGTRLESGVWRAPVVLARTDALQAMYPVVSVANSGFGAYAFTYRENKWPPVNAISLKPFVGFFR